MNSGLRIYRSRLGESFFLLTGLCRIHYTVWHCPSHVSKWTTFDFLTGKLKSSKIYTEPNGIGVSPTVSKPSSFSVVVCLPIKSPKHCLSTQRPSAIGPPPTRMAEPMSCSPCTMRAKLLRFLSNNKPNGAVNTESLETVTDFSKRINKESSLRLCRKIEARHPKAKKIHLFLDNASYYKAKWLEEQLKGSKIVLHFLPSYSPNLNLIERLWKFFKKEILYNTYYEKFEDFLAACNHSFRWNGQRSILQLPAQKRMSGILPIGLNLICHDCLSVWLLAPHRPNPNARK